MPERTRRRAARWRAPLAAGLGLLLGSAGLSLAAEEGASHARFPTARVHFEQNATDRDVEVVFQVKGRSEGLAKLHVTAPDGRKVVDFAAPDPSTLGIREFMFESPEPPDVARLKAAYPEGIYRFAATSVGGKELRGESTLSHALPAPTSIVRPGTGAEAVPLRGLEIAWGPVAGVAGYLVEIEQDELGAHLEVHLPASATSFRVPDGFLRAHTEYELGVATVSESGNVSFVETSFTTAE